MNKRTAAEMAECVALSLIEGVDAAAQGGFMRDDVCLLVAVVEGVATACIEGVATA